jgi:signal transduction histidine kinase
MNVLGTYQIPLSVESFGIYWHSTGNADDHAGDIWLSESSQSGTTSAQPFLLGCDHQGRVVWMSRHAQAELGRAEDLPAEFAGRMRAGSAYRVWPLLTLPDTLLIGAQVEERADRDGVRIEDGILRHHLRLERAERKLSARVKSRPIGNGGKVARQMELERQRLGRELHTGVGQMLAAIRLQLEVVASQISDPAEAVQRALEAIGRLAGDALEQVRGISRRLHPPEWQRLTLEAALAQLWEVSGIPQRFEARLSIQQLPHEPAHEIKVLFYRVAQEGLANIARHSGASQVEMTLEATDKTISLTLHDNGRGFDPSTLASTPANIESGIGLRSIREEAADLGAKLDIKSGPGGTTLNVRAHFAPRE